MENFITCLRSNLRKYLEEEVSSGRMNMTKAKELAVAIHEQVTHQITDRFTLTKISDGLIAKFPELQHAFVQAQLYCRLDENKRVVDDEVIKLVENNSLDEALKLLTTLKK